MAQTSSTHPAIQAYAARHGVNADAIRSDGRLTLSVDKRYRVHLRTLPDRRIALTARLLDLSGAARTDDILARLSGLATGMLRAHASTLCVDERDQALLLQELLDAQTDAAQLETTMADFLNALAFWSRVCAAEFPTAH